MDGKIIALGGSWHRWEWYALQQYTSGIAHVGLLSDDDDERDVFYKRLQERSCVPDHWIQGEDSAAWIEGQNIILLGDKVSRDLLEGEGVVSALLSFWMNGGVILASGENAGLLFAKSLDQNAEVILGWEFLQGSFCPEKAGSSYIDMVNDGFSGGYLVGKWSGLLFRGRHFQSALTLDETSFVTRVREDENARLETQLIAY